MLNGLHYFVWNWLLEKLISFKDSCISSYFKKIALKSSILYSLRIYSWKERKCFFPQCCCKLVFHAQRWKNFSPFTKIWSFLYICFMHFILQKNRVYLKTTALMYDYTRCRVVMIFMKLYSSFMQFYFSNKEIFLVLIMICLVSLAISL